MCVAAVALLLVACDGAPDPASPSAAVVEVRVLGSPGPVRFSGEIIVFRVDSPALAVTLDGSTTDPPGTLRLGEGLERVLVELAKVQEPGTLSAEVVVDGALAGTAHTSDPFGSLRVDVHVPGT